MFRYKCRSAVNCVTTSNQNIIAGNLSNTYIILRTEARNGQKNQWCALCKIENQHDLFINIMKVNMHCYLCFHPNLIAFCFLIFVPCFTDFFPQQFSWISVSFLYKSRSFNWLCLVLRLGCENGEVIVFAPSDLAAPSLVLHPSNSPVLTLLDIGES